MTTGAVWLIVFSLSLFIAAAVLCLLATRLSGRPSRRVFNSFTAAMFALFWAWPTLIAWATWAAFS